MQSMCDLRPDLSLVTDLPPVPDLPLVKGRYEFNQTIAPSTWFKVGGIVDVIYKPADFEDLINFLKQKPSSLPLICLGAASNVLISDAGFAGCVVRLGRGFSAIERRGNLLIIGAGCLDRTVALRACEMGLSGLEFLVGIPGTIGGAVAMNAGAYGREVKDNLQWVELVATNGNVETITASELGMSYRNGNLPPGRIVTRAAFLCEPRAVDEIQTKINHFLAEREKSQPIRGRTGGSTFKNPQNDLKAWQLIDQAGCRGLEFGDAKVSEKHCNFLLNLGNARATDLENLGRIVQQRVLEKSGVMLEWEIIKLGCP